MSGPQFGAIPLRALADPKLSAADLRLLGAIAYHDRFGGNGDGCRASPRRLAAMTGVRYDHIARQAARLAARGYIETTRAAAGDKRRKVYAVVYEEVASIGDILAAGAGSKQEVASIGDKQVANPKRYVVDQARESQHKRTEGKRVTKSARQGRPVRPRDPRQTEMLLPLDGGEQINWSGWFRALAGQVPEPVQWVFGALDRIEEHNGGDKHDAQLTLNAILKRWRTLDTESPPLAALLAEAIAA